MLDPVFDFFLKKYERVEVFIRKKARYFYIFLFALLIHELIDTFIVLFFKDTYETLWINFTSIAIFSFVFFLLFNRKLTASINIFMMFSIFKMVYLISQGDTTVIYVFLSLFILFMSAVHSKPIQYYISLGVVGGVLLTNSIILSRLLSSGDITQIELIAHVEAMLYVIVNIVLAFVFVTIVEQEILKSKKLVEMSTVDFLLKAHQRREKDKIKVVERNDKTSVLLVGIDHYSKINDEKGNETGDAILNEVIQVIRRTVRVDDYIVRWNMDDFLIILHYTPLSNAGIVAEKIRTVIEKNEFQSMKGKVTVTITAASSEEKETMHKAIEQAELLLKKTKDTHHNYVHIDYETK